jgi:putative oxidoreductase
MKSLQQLEESNTTLLSVPAEFLSRLPSARWAPIPLRLIVGYGFMEHGFAKLPRGPDSFSHPVRDRRARTGLHGRATILVEIFGGLAILLGAFVVLASIPMAAIILVAMFTVHLPYGFSTIKLQAVTAAGAQFGPPGYATDLLYLASLATLAIVGSGSLSIDGVECANTDVTNLRHPGQSCYAAVVAF